MNFQEEPLPYSLWIAEVERRLRETYGCPRHYNPEDPLDDLIFIVLSRMTQQTKYLRTYQEIERHFPTWELLRDAPTGEIVELIRDAGLADTKARTLKSLLSEITLREGALRLRRLEELGDEDAEVYLSSLPGVSRKTALCVLMYTLGRSVLPVDAHVWRISQRLGIAPPGPYSDRASRELERAVPARLRDSLHRTMLSHGREVCRAIHPRCEACILRDICPAGANGGWEGM